jgi:hypothetical protein
MFALCEQRVIFGAEWRTGGHGFGLLKRQITCTDCITKAESMEINDEAIERVGLWLRDWRRDAQA